MYDIRRPSKIWHPHHYISCKMANTRYLILLLFKHGTSVMINITSIFSAVCLFLFFFIIIDVSTRFANALLGNDTILMYSHGCYVQILYIVHNQYIGHISNKTNVVKNHAPMELKRNYSYGQASFKQYVKAGALFTLPATAVVLVSFSSN